MRTKFMLAGALAFSLVAAPAIFGRDHDNDARERYRYEHRVKHHRNSHYHSGARYRNNGRIYRNGGYYYRNEGLPPGLAKREQLPPGLQKHVRERGSLPPGLQKKVDRY